jgi:predicted MFS family arabinose efflux permease
LQEEAGFAPSAISLIMLVYGVSVAVGNIYGGKLADKKGPIRALTIIFSALAVILFALTFTMGSKVAAVITVLVWGAFAFGNVPGLQVYVVQLAEKFTPNAVDVASGLNIAAFNIGIAVGSILGGAIVDGMQLSDTAWIGAIISVAALLVTRYSGYLDKRAQA